MHRVTMKHERNGERKEERKEGRKRERAWDGVNEMNAIQLNFRTKPKIETKLTNANSERKMVKTIRSHFIIV